MLYHNAYVYTAERRFLHGGFRVEGGRFASVFTGTGPESVPNTGRPLENLCEPSEDLGGAYVIPGLVDIHTHGCAGADFSDGSLDGLRRMGAWYLRQGVTSFAPASMTLPFDTLTKAFQTAAEYRSENPENCARLAGIYMEGPFLSHARRGAQNPAYLRAPDFAAFRDLYEDCGGLIRVVCAAPELDGAASFARDAARLCAVSAAHTDASYDTAAAFFDSGASHLTHLFNAMPPILHRAPGVIGAAAEREGVTAELICDGLHVHPAAVRMAFRLFPGRLCLISDSLRCAGMPDGAYTLGGQGIVLRRGRAVLPDGTLAGSAVSLFEALGNAIAYGVPPEEAVAAATSIPARIIGRDGEIGSIESGKRADFLVCGRLFRDRTPLSGGTDALSSGQVRVFLGGRETAFSGTRNVRRQQTESYAAAANIREKHPTGTA